jgi:cytochrome P450
MSTSDALALIHPHAYAANGPPHELWTRLRSESPVAFVEPEGFESFWAVTRHEDICAVSKQPELFSSAPGIVILSELQQELRASDEGLGAMRIIIEMDPPEHREFRKVTSPSFTPRAVRSLDEVVDRSARELVDELAAAAGPDGVGECDFATDVAARHPLRVLSTILGLPREEEPKVLQLTNQLFAADDPELRREGEDRAEATKELGLELYQMFDRVIQDRRAKPTDDLASILANGKVNGEPMGAMETFGYFLITFTAGHDTTKNALVGGMRAFLDFPDQFEKLKANPALVEAAVEELVRWTTPVNYMARTVTRDTELRGQKLRKDDRIAIFYASANRDEDVFDDPFSLRIDRWPNRHLGFGIGEHFCLGANLARRSQHALWLELARRLEWAKPAGEPEQIHSSFVVGLKHLPMQYRVSTA